MAREEAYRFECSVISRLYSTYITNANAGITISVHVARSGFITNIMTNTAINCTAFFKNSGTPLQKNQYMVFESLFI